MQKYFEYTNNGKYLGWGRGMYRQKCNRKMNTRKNIKNLENKYLKIPENKYK